MKAEHVACATALASLVTVLEIANTVYDPPVMFEDCVTDMEIKCRKRRA